jgi:hypothetical protein
MERSHKIKVDRVDHRVKGLYLSNLAAAVFHDEGDRREAALMGNHFSNRHSPNSTSMVSTANPVSKTTGPNQSIFVAFAKASLRQARHPLKLQHQSQGNHNILDIATPNANGPHSIRISGRRYGANLQETPILSAFLASALREKSFWVIRAA